jgi:hypothetical protein
MYQDRLAWNLIVGPSMKICREYPNFVKIGQQIIGTLYKELSHLFFFFFAGAIKSP